ncbi:DUF2235 domain-containing protein [Salipiger aestuarii]|uniref:Putative alpha/beta hydrolase family protein DUF2235 n=1 Tax=Salipiger aestuarii TaxID=568098 RepID=A0A327XNU2_9RHOB|nr:DUF2235 domain-containing protein [Salipiger aestuarii]EIE49092.1 hypothetical protein C357_20727 [Citreicella sp. 357]KAA8605964.1 hypothetical protein AL037_20900 [Salipiger aestuarii]KAB2538691.1 hypothetical protein AL035_18925 [Salipiger aestuarii]RAK09871.1 putative alpha/beta hydrolase family protein DUF2235 [Salipiger aestuarii]
MARLVICCDGTWNSPEQEVNGLPSPTNVVRLKASLVRAGPDGLAQTAYYRFGVGTSGGLLRRLREGGLGIGLGEDIKSAYHWLATTWKPGDALFLFGFSRGAYAVRSLAGMIARCGLLDLGAVTGESARWDRVDAAYAAYRRLPAGTVWDTPLPRALDVPIRFMGVWDTVGALGIPQDFGINVLRRVSRYRFHDTHLGKSVQTARHALAIDERRQSFSPTLWQGHDAGRDIRQVWFPGVHADIGGGYRERGLGDISLRWMIDEAAACGLTFDARALSQIAPDARGVRHRSARGIFAVLGRRRPRAVPRLDLPSDAVHPCVQARRQSPPLDQPDYWPERRLDGTARLPVFARERWNATGLWLDKGNRYRLEASGEWLDLGIRCTPAGPEPGQALFKAFWLLSAPSNALQTRLRRRPGNGSAVVWGARRAAHLPWFSLVGVIANGRGADEARGKVIPHETLAIGAGGTFSPRHSGYLYCYANDVWRLYGNNRGKVTLTVTRLAP